MKIYLLFLCLFWPCLVYSAPESTTKSRYWEPSFKEIKVPTIIGIFEREAFLSFGKLRIIFRGNSTCDATDGARYLIKNVKWKQRDDGKIYVERKTSLDGSELKVRLECIGYLKGNDFRWDESGYYDDLKRVK